MAHDPGGHEPVDSHFSLLLPSWQAWTHRFEQPSRGEVWDDRAEAFEGLKLSRPNNPYTERNANA